MEKRGRNRKEGELREHRRTTRTRRPQIRYHLATTDVICMRVSPLRHGEEKEKEKNRRKGKERSILPYPLHSPSAYLPTFVDLRSRRSVDNRAFVPRAISSFFFFLGIALSLFISPINSVGWRRFLGVTSSSCTDFLVLSVQECVTIFPSLRFFLFLFHYKLDRLSVQRIRI